MDWQQATSIGIVVLTATLLARVWINQKRHPKLHSCGGHCTSCEPPSAGGSPMNTMGSAQVSNTPGRRARQEREILAEIMNRNR